MNALYAPAPLNDLLRHHDWQATTTVREKSYSAWIPQAHDIADRATSQIRRQKNPLSLYGKAHEQIIHDEIADAVRLHMSGLTWPPRYKYTITLKKTGHFVTAYVRSEEDK